MIQIGEFRTSSKPFLALSNVLGEGSAGPERSHFFLSLHIAHDPARRKILDGRMRIWIYQRSNGIQVVAVSDPRDLSFLLLKLVAL